MKLAIAKYFKINFMSISPTGSIRLCWPFYREFLVTCMRAGMQVLRGSLKVQNHSAPVCQIIRLAGRKGTYLHLGFSLARRSQRAVAIETFC